MPEVSNPGVGRLQDATGNGISSVLDNANMAAGDRLLGVGALEYIFDGTLGLPVHINAARSLAPGDAGIVYHGVLPMLANGTSYDPKQNNTEGTLLASAVRAASVASADQTLYDGAAVLLLHLNISAASGTGGLSVRIQTKDPITGTYAQLNASEAPLIAVAFRTYVVCTGPAATIQGDVKQVTPGVMVGRTWRVQVIHTDASNYTYSVGYQIVRSS